MHNSKSKTGIIAIAGRPNAGKSTLLNNILETSLSIVTPKPQTTRERIHGVLNSAEGQIVFVDTPGIHQAKAGGINAYMVQEAEAALDTPSLIWYIFDPFSSPEFEQPVLNRIIKSKAPVFLIANKCDIKPRDKVNLNYNPLSKLKEDLSKILVEAGVNLKNSFEISAKRGTGVAELLKQTWDILDKGEFLYPDTEMLSDRPVRFFVSEKIREQLFLKLGDELPYSCAIQIEEFSESKKPTHIRAVIHVERESQKGMVIGQKGAKIKEVGQAARKEIETFLGEKVFLGLRVNVYKNWTKNPQALAEMGYHV